MVVVLWCYHASCSETCVTVLAAMLIYRLFRCCILFFFFFSPYLCFLGFISLWITTARLFKEDRHCQVFYKGRNWCWALGEHNTTEAEKGKDQARGSSQSKRKCSESPGRHFFNTSEKYRPMFHFLAVLIQQLFSWLRKAGLLTISNTHLDLLLFCIWGYEKYRAHWNTNAYWKYAFLNYIKDGKSTQCLE